MNSTFQIEVDIRFSECITEIWKRDTPKLEFDEKDILDITKIDIENALKDGKILTNPGSKKPIRKIDAPRFKVKPDGNPLNTPPYKDVNGKYRTSSLFVETINSSLDPAYQPRFTLQEWDTELAPTSQYYNCYENHIVPSLRRIYLEYTDPSEFVFAMEVFKSTRHWKIFQELEWFKPYLEEWRSSLDLKIRSEAIQNLIRISGSMDEAKALQAAKWLAEGSYRPKREKGRPTAQEELRELKTVTDQKNILLEDAERLGIVLTTETTPKGNA